jgi:Tfp pilus assembly protein PilV
MRAFTRSGSGRQDHGFTLIEIILAMFLTVVVMTALLGVLVSSLKSVTQARQRQTATALATQSLERLRALPYDSVTGSAATTYPKTVGLQYVTTSGTTDTFAPNAVLTGVSEPLVVNEYSAKRASTTVDGVAYVIQTYVTKPAPTTAGQQAYNLTALVSWTSSVFPVTRTTAERSTEYSPAGCLSTAQRPFAAPCQAYFTAQAGLSASGFSVTNADDSKLDIPGIAGRLVELNMPVLSANLQIEQTASGSAVGATSGARAVSGTTAGVGGVSAPVSVDSDPSSTPSQEQTASAYQTSGSVSITGTSGTLSATPTSGDTASSAAAIQATSTTCTEGDVLGTALATGPTGLLRPCASAAAKQSGMPGSISYVSPSAVAVSILSLGVASQTARAVAANLATGTPGIACFAGAGAVSPGCAHSKAYRTLGNLVVGSPATGVGPASFDVNKGLFRITGLVESASSERGPGAGTPAYSRAGALTVWNGTGYTDFNLSDPTGLLTPSYTWTIPDTTTTYSGGLTVTASGKVIVQRPGIVTTGSDCKVAACVAQVSGAGGISAQTLFIVSVGGTEITRFALVSSVGGLVAQSTYTAAPDA